MGIKDELKTYEAFTTAVDDYISGPLISGSRESLQQGEKAAEAYAKIQKNYATLHKAHTELWAYINDKPGSDNKELKRSLEKFFKGTGNSKTIAESIYSDIVFKTASVERSFKKAYKTKVKLVARFMDIAMARNSLSRDVNKAIELYNDSGTLGMAVFRARYYISGSMLNHSGMSGTDGKLENKVKRAEKLIEDLADGEKKKYVTRIKQVRSRHSALMKECGRLGGAADVIQSASESINFNDDWEAMAAALKTTYKVSLRPLKNVTREANRHALFRQCLVLEKGRPFISADLVPDGLAPSTRITELSPEEKAREEWLAVTDGFSMEGPVLRRSLTEFKAYLEQGHLDDFTDWDSDGVVMPVFNSWIQPATRQLQPTIDVIIALESAFEGEDIEAFRKARGDLAAQIALLDRETAAAISTFKSTRAIFKDQAVSDEQQLNIASIAQKLENDHQSIIAELKAVGRRSR